MNDETDALAEDIDAIHISIKQAQSNIRLGEALERLHKNKDFQQVIMSDYINGQAVRLTHLLSEHAFSSDEQQTKVIRELSGIAHFVSYLRMVAHQASMSTDSIRQNEQELQALATASANA